MHRQPLSDLLARYEANHPDEKERTERVRALINKHSNCFERSCLPGHITASAWIASADRRRFVLAHHRKLNQWLQLGGHADGDRDVRAVALREAREESGMCHFDWFEPNPGSALLDVDVHRIPAIGDEPAHEHHDMRFLLIARPGQPLRVSPESNDLRWFDFDEFKAIVEDESLLRLGGKARRALAGGMLPTP